MNKFRKREYYCCVVIYVIKWYIFEMGNIIYVYLLVYIMYIYVVE